ncbi:hypothetical protein M9Y10_019008 [Tritrichomonas musculus]|uniref:Small GTP-binding protein n=1 Tax=Tritrichomonas musculus TaxID=1915356 RepID=A0ABR2HIB7_9EUKA
MDEPEISFKIIILGDTGVGKTSLALRQCRNQFSFHMTPTVGTTHLKTVIKVNNKLVELKIWDTAGQEQFASLVSMYARGANACIIVGSFVDQGSLTNIETWCERLHAAGEDPPIIIAINKIDMEEGSLISTDQIREMFMSKFPNLFFVSAKRGDGVNELFTCAADEALKANITQKKDSGVKLDESQKRNSCC